MTSATPWSVKGIDSKAREVAKDLARRSGMTLGEWLNHMILEGHDVAAVIRDESRRSRPYDSRPETRMETRYESGRHKPARNRRPLDEPDYDDGADYEPDLSRVARALEGLGARIETSETRSANAVRGVSQAVEALLNRLERSEEALANTDSRIEARLQETVSGASERLQRETAQTRSSVLDRLDGLSGNMREDRERIARLEDQLANNTVAETVQSLEATLGKLANQLYENDTRTRDTLKGMREDMLGLSHRLAQSEQRDPERTAQAAIDKVITRLSQRLETAEAQTSTAIRGLEQAFASLDARLLRAEESGDVTDPESVQSLSRLASDLSRQIDDSRFEIRRALEQDTQTQIDQAVSQISTRLNAVEKRSARAIESMGQDVLKIAGNLNQRMTEVERSTSGAIAHLSHKLDDRLGQAENSHAQALERLGGEIARISERLNLKIIENEKRTSQVLQGVGEELDSRHQRTHADIADRIRQSEERTQKLLEEARSKIDSRLGQARTQNLLQELRPTPELPTPFGPTDLEKKPFAEFEHGFDETEAETTVSADSNTPEITETDLTARLLEDVTAQADDSDLTAPVTKSAFDPFEDDFDTELSALAPQAPKMTPAPVESDDPFAEIDASRRASPDLLFEDDDQPMFNRKPDALASGKDETAPTEFSTEPDSVSLSTRDALAAARAAVRASIDGGDETKKTLGLKLGQSRTKAAATKPAKAGGSTLMRAIKASSVAMVLTTAAVGSYVLMQDRPDPKAPSQDDIRLASALTGDPASTPSAEDDARLKAMYEAATLTLQSNDPKAAETMKSVALLGYAPAQYHMSLIYSGEGNLVKTDKAEARNWAERAAAGGHAPAMYNLGIMLYNGDGGSQDRVGAAQWFRKAAEYGVRDSYYNMGALYQQGDGVPMNLTEAYKWFSIAAKAGDTEASRTLSLIKPQLTAQQIATAETQAAAFKPVTAQP
ncbi:SEL1-like repeat protein [Asticcacaulis tiandongensis]|uniref:SEL1-like repeat protein n=1 Tax=Asticcacaulis tiandongensis TaxID=2565365 RepID=UPI00112BD5CA|nr:SEL1-like repeat protein [Asticcacaulis tiandongensis]